MITYATDVSESGVFVRANRPLPVGTRVKLELHPSRGQRVAMSGVVIRTPGDGPKGMGLAFVEVDARARAGLSQLVGRVGMQTMVTAADAEAFVYHRGR